MLQWRFLCHSDYCDVIVDRTEFERCPPVFVVHDLLESMARVSDVSIDDNSRTGVATEDPDAPDVLGDLPVTVSSIIDVNNVSECQDSTTLHRASSLVATQTGVTINVVTGNRILNEHENPSYFTSAFPTLFCWGTGGHLDPRREPPHALSFAEWIRCTLRHSSRRFQADHRLVSLSFDLARRCHNMSKTNSLASRTESWPRTRTLLESLTPERLTFGAHQAQRYEPISDPAVKELLKFISRVGSTATGSDERKSYMLAQLKSSIIYHGCPLIFLTLNPSERHSAISLYYAGDNIDVKAFYPELYDAAHRLNVTLRNPLAVVEYFHTIVNTILDTMMKGGMFGDLLHHYGPIEYGGRGAPHTHLAVSFPPPIV